MKFGQKALRSCIKEIQPVRLPGKNEGHVLVNYGEGDKITFMEIFHPNDPRAILKTRVDISRFEHES